MGRVRRNEHTRSICKLTENRRVINWQTRLRFFLSPSMSSQPASSSYALIRTQAKVQEVVQAGRACGACTCGLPVVGSSAVKSCSQFSKQKRGSKVWRENIAGSTARIWNTCLQRYLVSTLILETGFVQIFQLA
ncbi:hypothetical protein Y032_0518g2820 [Ancylostoma ceylanicum]|nr:hypothetical protein Y032_0518g2820 [Ancylostoma ceylanicum]